MLVMDGVVENIPGWGCGEHLLPRVGLGSQYKQVKHPKGHGTLVFS